MKPLPSVKVTVEVGGKVHRLALIPQPFKGRFWLRYNGKALEKLPCCTKTQLVSKIGELLQLEGKETPCKK